jgi:hypothetical protein
MKITEVKEVPAIEEKSSQEIEQELIDGAAEVIPAQDEAEIKAAEEAEAARLATEAAAKTEVVELKDEDVLSFMNKKSGREGSSLEDYLTKEESKEVLPEDVATFLKYKKDTGRGLDDFANLSRDIESINPDALLKDYLTRTNKGLDEDDIDYMMKAYKADEMDDDSESRHKKLKYKQDIAKAKDYFGSEKEKYSVPLESSGSSISDDDQKALEAHKQYMSEAATYEEEAKRKSDWFSKKTDEVFGAEFKGFEFSVDEDKKVTYSPGDANEIKSLQTNPQNFIGKFLDEDGLLKDAQGYHKALYAAMNPEKLAKFFYEQGKAEGVDGHIKEIKNINMSERAASAATAAKGGTQFKAVPANSGNGLKIKSSRN